MSVDDHIGDDALDALLSGELDAVAREALELHLDRCSQCRLVVSDLLRAEASSPPSLAGARPSVGDRESIPTIGEMIGRYVLLSVLGTGGMGRVFEAYDTRLRRNVAIKLLLAHEAPRWRARLLREAQALARLSHPNIVTVHDVDQHRGSPYIAMELIDGQDLGSWVEAMRPTPRAVVAACVCAARGIAAAHQAGLVHRDIKPSNILRGGGGRIAVVDFGLFGTRPSGGPTKCEHALWDPERGGRATLVGTPGYMAPEQADGEAVDERADQFSLCATVYRLLEGRLPFEGTNLDELAANARTGHLRRFTGTCARKVEQVLRRGLDPDPARRFASMTELGCALSVANQRPLRRWTAVTAALGVSVSLVAVARSSIPLCSDANGAVERIWGQQRDVVRGAFVAASPHGADTFSRVDPELAQLLGGWARERTKVCAARTDGAASPEDVYLRTACLARIRTGVEQLVGTFATADAEVVDRAVPALRSLEPASQCGDVDALRSGQPFVPEALRSDVDDAQRWLAQATMSMRLGRYDDAREYTREAQAVADRIEFAPLQGETQLKLYEVFERQGRYPDALDSLQRASFTAEAAGDDVVAARAKISLVYLLSTRLDRDADARLLAPFAEAASMRVTGDLRASLLGDLELRLAGMSRRASDSDTALGHLQRAQEHLSRIPSERVTVAQVHEERGHVYVLQGRWQRSLEEQERAVSILEAELGPRHPNTLFVRGNHASRLVDVGEYEQAVRALDAVIDDLSDVLGPDHAQLSVPLINRAMALSTLDRQPEAISLLQRALEVRERHRGERSPSLIAPLIALSQNMHDMGWVTEAGSTVDRALALVEAHPDTAPLRKVDVYLAKAYLLLDSGELEAASGWLTQALDIVRSVPGDLWIAQANVLFRMGELEIARGDPDAALYKLAQARAAIEAISPGDPFVATIAEAEGEALGQRGRVHPTKDPEPGRG